MDFYGLFVDFWDMSNLKKCNPFLNLERFGFNFGSVWGHVGSSDFVRRHVLLIFLQRHLLFLQQSVVRDPPARLHPALPVQPVFLQKPGLLFLGLLVDPPHIVAERS